MNAEQKQRFLKHGIPYDDIDKEMLDLIDVLNFDLNVPTIYCCYGHEARKPSYIVFDPKVTDEEIYSLANSLGELMPGYGSFNKWVRSKPLLVNWTFETGMRFDDPNCTIKKKLLDRLTNHLKYLSNELN